MIVVVFWALVGTFVLVVSQLFIPAIGELFKGSLLFLLPFAIFSLLGAVLTFLTLRKKVKGKLRKFLILTGVSATGFFISVLLHNFFYALGVIASRIIILKYLMEFFHGAFFIIAIFVCPIGFLIGAVRSGILFIKETQGNWRK